MNIVIEQGVLRCPKCGSENLHHHAITVCDRNEDADTVIRSVIEGSATRMDVCANDASRNPSSRRHGLFIQFSCEICGRQDLELTFAQHKGQTYVEWR